MRIACVTAAALLALGAPAARAAWNHPTSAASGDVRVSWVEDQGRLGGPGTNAFHAEGAVRWTVSSRAMAAGDPAAWVPGAFPDWSDGGRGLFGFYLRATVTVERFAAVARAQCEDGSVAERTTTLAELVDPHALLVTLTPRLDVGHRRGTLHVAVPLVTLDQDGHELASAFVGAGRVRVTTTGTDCTGATPEGLGTTAPVEPVTIEETVDRMMGSAAFVSAVQEEAESPVAVSPPGTLVVHAARTGRAGGLQADHTVSHTYAADLRLAGSLAEQSALCDLPSPTQMHRVRSLRAARALLRRYGFPRAVLGPARRPHPEERGGRFALDSGSGDARCAETLGTRRHPVLVALRRG